MYTLLVVDDEDFAVKGIAEGIDWRDLAIDHIYEALDVKMAKQMLSEHPIDIMISDIEMPGENGLHLLEWVREHSVETETIFLTGHANFSYAQKAIQLGSCDYALKPIDHDLLKEMVAKAIVKIKTDKETREFKESYNSYHKLWHNQLPVLIERFWQDVLAHRIPLMPDRLENYYQQYYLPLNYDSLIQPILISIEQWDQELSTRDEEIMEYAVRKAASELILRDHPGSVLQDTRGVNLAIFYDAGIISILKDELQQRCRDFINASNRYFHCSVSCYLGAKGHIKSLDQSVQQLLYIERNNIAQTNIVMDHIENHSFGVQAKILPAFAEWTALFENGKKDELLHRVDHYLQHMKQKGINSEMLETFYYGLLNMIYNTVHHKGLSIRDIKGDKEVIDISAIHSIPQLKNWACRLIENGAKCLFENHRDMSAVTSKVQLYIAKHLHEELTREDIASSVYLNSAYLSRLFKKETGISLSDYILKARIEKAKALLTEGNIKISSIAEMTGYSHFSHFAKMFKKIEGISPSEFRKKCQHPGNSFV
jgi:two-component system response regulator YesN